MWFDWKTATAAAEQLAAARRAPAPGLRAASTALLAAALALAAGCAHGRPETLPPQTVAERPPSPEGEQPASAPAPPAPRGPSEVITIEAAEEEPSDTQSLVETARRERQRRNRTSAPVAVITDKNLKQHATGQLTFMDPEDPLAGETADAATEAAAAGEGGDGEVRGEAYWRARVGELRASWREALDRVPELEQRAAGLRQEFYAADDAYYRDSRIKPAWDRAIDQIAQSQAAAEAYRLELEEALDEGRRAGALPGWLREGIELEPAPEEPPTDEHQPGEPEVVEIDGTGNPR